MLEVGRLIPNVNSINVLFCPLILLARMMVRRLFLVFTLLNVTLVIEEKKKLFCKEINKHSACIIWEEKKKATILPIPLSRK